MKKAILFLLLPFMLPAIAAHAYQHGHGGGHGGGRSGGGHSSSHSSFSGHSSARTQGQSAHTGARTSQPASKRMVLPGTARSVSNTAIDRSSSSPRTITTGGTAIRSGVVGSGSREGYYYNPGYYAHQPYYYYTPGYYYDPYFYSPYMSMWSFGSSALYSTHYTYDEPNANNNDNLIETMEGLVVFEHDTITGTVTITNNAISLQTADSLRPYDYKFKAKNKGLEYVSIYSSDNKQVDLVRLNGDSKHLWRVIHEGKLNLYDERRGFIYRPEDIDASSMMVVYDGATTKLGGKTLQDKKMKLTEYVNKAYSMNLDPKEFSWKQLLVYIDKLD